MIKAMIIDDEWYTLQDIKEMAEATGFIEVCGIYENPLEALKAYERILPEVIFVDIDMPEINGLTLAENLLKKTPSLQVVFITAYNQYAVEAFEINALDYIIKPISTQRFSKMADRLKKSIDLPNNKESQLNIQCFGDFEVKIDEVLVKWQRAKAEELFAYLLTNHNRKVRKEIIIEELWREYEPQKAIAILQTSVCKIRNVFSQLKERVKLEYSGGSYYLSISSCNCDLFEVEKVLNFINIKNENAYEDLEKVYNLLEKGLLQQDGYIWSYQKEVELRKALSTILENGGRYYKKNSNKTMENKYCRLLDKLEYCEE
jgi:two-component system LytT family response regulator